MTLWEEYLTAVNLGRYYRSFDEWCLDIHCGGGINGTPKM